MKLPLKILVATLQLQQEENIRMRDAIRLGKNFYEWLREQKPRPHKKEYNALQMIYSQLEDAIIPLPSEKLQSSDGQFVVTRSCGHPIKSEQLHFVIHATRKAAEEHGKKFYDYGDFRIFTLPVFLNTPTGQYYQRVQENLQRIQSISKFKPKPQQLKQQQPKISKPKQDKINYLQAQIVTLQIQGNIMQIARLQQQIRKLKAQ